MHNTEAAYNLPVSRQRSKKELSRYYRYFKDAFKNQMIDPDAAFCKWRNEKPQGWVKYDVEAVLHPAHNLREMIAIAQQTNSPDSFFNNLTKEKRIRIISFVVLEDLLKKGFFIKDPRYDSARYFFHETEKEVYPIRIASRFNPVFESYLINHYNLLLDVETVLKFILSHAIEHYQEREIHRYFYFDRKEQLLFIFDRKREYYRLDGENVEKFPNGKHILFQREKSQVKISYLPLNERINPDIKVRGIIQSNQKGDYLWQLFLDRTNFNEHSALSYDEQKVQLGLYFYTIPFVNMLNTKPIMALIGEKGSGKTFTIKMIGKFLLNETFAVRLLDDKESLIVAVANNLIVVLDNVDKFTPWLQDLITSIATGGAIGRRELYTTIDEVEIVPSCFIVLTSRRPYFKRDDVADRLLIFHCDRLKDFVDEPELLKDIIDNRDFLWSLYIDDLNKIIKKLKDSDISNFKTTHRLADWTKLALLVDSALGLSKEYNTGFLELLDNMEHEKAHFQFENDSLLPVLKQYATINQGKWASAAEILEELKELDDSIDLTTVAFAKKLNNKKEALDIIIGFKIDDNPRGKSKKYCLGNKITEKIIPISGITLEDFLLDSEIRVNHDPSMCGGGGGYINKDNNTIIPPPLHKKVMPTFTPHLGISFSMGDLFEQAFNNCNGKGVKKKHLKIAGDLIGIDSLNIEYYMNQELKAGRMFEPKKGLIMRL